MKDFFHENKRDLLDYYSHFKDPNVKKQSGMLLYGPPGTGKSNFIYRLANELQRDIIYIDLTITKKSSLYGLIYNSGMYGFEIKTSIIAFDEFDYAVKFLYEREQKMLAVTKKTETDIKDIIKDALITQKIDKIDDKPKNEDFLTLNDLLDLFCGTVPLNGAIFMATTNEYECIYSIKPALFREGRLTPILFNYFSVEILDEISMFYFNKPLLLSNMINNTISNVTIINLATKYSNVENGFNKFKSNIESLLIKQH